jgi:hypothetical protein
MLFSLFNPRGHRGSLYAFCMSPDGERGRARPYRLTAVQVVQGPELPPTRLMQGLPARRTLQCNNALRRPSGGRDDRETRETPHRRTLEPQASSHRNPASGATAPQGRSGSGRFHCIETQATSHQSHQMLFWRFSTELEREVTWRSPRVRSPTIQSLLARACRVS